MIACPSRMNDDSSVVVLVLRVYSKSTVHDEPIGKNGRCRIRCVYICIYKYIYMFARERACRSGVVRKAERRCSAPFAAELSHSDWNGEPAAPRAAAPSPSSLPPEVTVRVDRLLVPSQEPFISKSLGRSNFTFSVTERVATSKRRSQMRSIFPRKRVAPRSPCNTESAKHVPPRESSA